MSAGGSPSGPRRDQDAGDGQTFADVLNAFSFGTSRRRRKDPGTRGTPQEAAHPETEEPAQPPAEEPYAQAPAAEGEPPAWQPGDAGDEAPASSVRAYVWTGGRTRSRHHFEVETLVTAAEPGDGSVTQPHRTVLALCREPRSVAEVAARLAMPLGVAMVLLGDMADRGMIVVHDASTGADGTPSPLLMERVLHGLRQL